MNLTGQDHEIESVIDHDEDQEAEVLTVKVIERREEDRRNTRRRRKSTRRVIGIEDRLEKIPTCTCYCNY